MSSHLHLNIRSKTSICIFLPKFTGPVCCIVDFPNLWWCVTKCQTAYEHMGCFSFEGYIIIFKKPPDLYIDIFNPPFTHVSKWCAPFNMCIFLEISLSSRCHNFNLAFREAQLIQFSLFLNILCFVPEIQRKQGLHFWKGNYLHKNGLLSHILVYYCLKAAFFKPWNMFLNKNCWKPLSVCPNCA